MRTYVKNPTQRIETEVDRMRAKDGLLVQVRVVRQSKTILTILGHSFTYLERMYVENASFNPAKFEMMWR